MMNLLRDTTARKLRVIALPLILSTMLSACFGGGGGDDNTTAGAGTDTNTSAPSADPGTSPSTDTNTDTNTAPTPPPADTSTAPTPEPTQTQRSAVLLWNAPTTNTDGTALTNLQGYKIYRGTSAGNLSKVAEVSKDQTSYNAAVPSSGTYYFAVSAFNGDNAESDLSNVGSKTFTN